MALAPTVILAVPNGLRSLPERQEMHILPFRRSLLTAKLALQRCETPWLRRHPRGDASSAAMLSLWSYCPCREFRFPFAQVNLLTRRKD